MLGPLEVMSHSHGSPCLRDVRIEKERKSYIINLDYNQSQEDWASRIVTCVNILHLYFIIQQRYWSDIFLWVLPWAPGVLTWSVAGAGISSRCNFVFIWDLWLLPSVTHYISVPSNLKYPAQQLLTAPGAQLYSHNNSRSELLCLRVTRFS